MKLKTTCLALAVLLLLGGCTGAAPSKPQISDEEAPRISGLAYTHSMELRYAQCFQVYYYEDGYAVISVTDGRSYLLIPEGGAEPEGCENYVILRQPLNQIYLAATSAMSLFQAVDGLDAVRLSGTRQEGWYIDGAVKAMAAGDMLYAGKYAQPDYELMVTEHCGLAIESTMIYHCPEVLEKIEELGIPVFVDRSSYEPHPLGRTEWIRLYGLLLGKEAAADAQFGQQVELVEGLKDFPNTEQSVAYFYITTDGSVVVRKSTDYLATMIGLAGGRYVHESLGDANSASSSVTLTMEQFYADAKDADYLIYNATIDDPLETVSQLLGKSELFADFRAVREGNVWCTGKYLYQATDRLGNMILDLNTMLSGGNETQLTFIHKLT